ncbi:MAG: ABC transporter permease [Prevotellaceae bacterium]|jgi:putative ABC transport system permease protein|nr:ABC transporter permease [Prevotellaceae bacterium]
MFRIDFIREILLTMKQNRLRTFLTGFAVAWGIFMLIILLSAGNGLQNGILSNFSSQAKNYVIVYPGWTSKPYKGYATGRRVELTKKDFELFRDKIPEVEYLSAGMRTSLILSYEQEYTSISLEGATSELTYINNIGLKEGMGRFINKMDDLLRRKVIVIHPEHQKILFKDQDPIGKYVIAANNVAFKVIGVYGSSDNFNNNNPPAYIPLSTTQMLYNRRYGFNYIEFTATGLHTVEANEAFNQRIRQKMATLHNFDPTDRSALYIHNSFEESLKIQKVFGVVDIFLIIVGLASMMAGIVGVGNIMVITVKERTREIGIRKSIGASPASVLRLIIFESVFVTTCAGYIGIVIGVAITELLSTLIKSQVEGTTMFLNPTVNMTTVFGATLLLIICGTLAGLIPALKAVKVKPIEAMRAE